MGVECLRLLNEIIADFDEVCFSSYELLDFLLLECGFHSNIYCLNVHFAAYGQGVL